MRWKYTASKQLWTFGDYAIELCGNWYELYHLATFVKGFSSVEDAKRHANGMARIAGELPKRGRPKSADSCHECGPAPSDQRRN